jgi:hypothetical protein
MPGFEGATLDHKSRRYFRQEVIELYKRRHAGHADKSAPGEGYRPSGTSHCHTDEYYSASHRCTVVIQSKLVGYLHLYVVVVEQQLKISPTNALKGAGR